MQITKQNPFCNCTYLRLLMFNLLKTEKYTCATTVSDKLSSCLWHYVKMLMVWHVIHCHSVSRGISTGVRVKQ